MKKLKCTNPKDYKLTLNGEYEILDESTDLFTIINDSGKKVNYAKNNHKARRNKINWYYHQD